MAAMTASFLGSRTCLTQTARPARNSSSSCGRSVTMAAATNSREDVWLPGTSKPSYLEGTVGNFGFDPFLFGTDKERLQWYAEAEKTNARWAMMAVAGILGQELLGRSPEWFNVGATEQWMPQPALLAIEFVTLGHFETKRFQGWNKHKTSGVLDSYPFDPLSQTSKVMELREIKNGRLAMVAFVGFAVQALVTREQPIEGLKNHLADPFGHNIITNIGNLPAFIGKA